jgi:hypothetical protein
LAKSAIVANIVADIRQEGGSFCKYEKGEWFEIGDYDARQKVSALLRDLRDLLPTAFRCSVARGPNPDVLEAIPALSRASEILRVYEMSDGVYDIS